MSSVSALTDAAGVAALQRLDQRPVVMGRGNVALLVMDLGGGAHIGTGLQPQAFDDRDQHGRAGGAVDIEVEGVVEFRGVVRLVGIVAAERRIACDRQLPQLARSRRASDWARPAR